MSTTTYRQLTIDELWAHNTLKKKLRRWFADSESETNPTIHTDIVQHPQTNNHFENASIEMIIAQLDEITLDYVNRLDRLVNTTPTFTVDMAKFYLTTLKTKVMQTPTPHPQQETEE